MMASELIETSKLFAHTVAKIEPDRVLQAAKTRLHRHFEPHYNHQVGQVWPMKASVCTGWC